MHPNLREVERALSESGSRCTFVVSNVGPSEPSRWTGRVVVDPRTLTEESAHDLLSKYEPDVVVQRNFRQGFINIWSAALVRGIRTFVYNQDPHEIPIGDFFVRPMRVIRSARDIFHDRLRLGTHTRLTPVLFWGRGGSPSFRNSRHLPLPMRDRYLAKGKVAKIPTVVLVAKHGQRRKRQAWLIRALSEAENPFRLDMIGSTPEPSDRRSVKNYANLRKQALALGDRASLITFYENLEEGAVHRKYRAADIFVLPAKREMMAISPLEAMSHGLPVLVSADGGAASYVRQTGSEQVFRSRSYRDFRRRLNRLIGDVTLRERLSRAVINSIRTTHSPRSFIESLGFPCEY